MVLQNTINTEFQEFFSLIFPHLMLLPSHATLYITGAVSFVRGPRFFRAVVHIYLEHTIEAIFEIQVKAKLIKRKLCTGT